MPNLDPRLAINPSSAQVASFLTADQMAPVTFLNLHRYYDRARYPQACAVPPEARDVSGREAYHRYLREVASRYLPQVGARFLIVRECELTFVGTGDWHEVVIGRYPSRGAALELPSLAGYEDIAVHRLAGLEAALTVVISEQDAIALAGSG
ncbi:MAG TPA: hypothetical protein VLT59_16525 [Steroidobacteraceae bacterium]|nr:hypothetical protein [Steroidobacteraceae bacterium]